MKYPKLATAIILAVSTIPVFAANVALVGNGASTGPYITSSVGADIALGTRLRVGTFTDTTILNNAILSFNSGAADYSTTLASLNGVFTDLGTNVANYGNANQSGTGVSPTQAVFNTTASLTVNGVTAARNVFNGSIANVNYSSSIGSNKSVYVWTAFNGEIGIFRDSTWTTPASDLTALTLNLSGITAGTASSEILLGSYQDYASGNDQLRLAGAAVIPEPSSASLLALGVAGLVALRVRRKS
jgi:hypothetical protein